MSLILFGFQGSGKTYWGERLADALELPFLDTDQLIEVAHGVPCRELAHRYGETQFRLIEKRIVQALPSSPAVIALGGGAILDRESQYHLQQIGTLLYLKLPFDLLKKRTFSMGTPSYLDPKDPENAFDALYKKRLPLYQNIPALCIDLENQDDTSILKTFLAMVHLR